MKITIFHRKSRFSSKIDQNRPKSTSRRPPGGLQGYIYPILRYIAMEDLRGSLEVDFGHFRTDFGSKCRFWTSGGSWTPGESGEDLRTLGGPDRAIEEGPGPLQEGPGGVRRALDPLQEGPGPLLDPKMVILGPKSSFLTFWDPKITILGPKSRFWVQNHVLGVQNGDFDHFRRWEVI